MRTSITYEGKAVDQKGTWHSRKLQSFRRNIKDIGRWTTVHTEDAWARLPLMCFLSFIPLFCFDQYELIILMIWEIKDEINGRYYYVEYININQLPII